MSILTKGQISPKHSAFRPEGVFSGVLLVSDMDGTLLDSNEQVSPENILALNYFVAEGGLFTVATGRMLASVQPYFSYLPINAPAILYNGALIYNFRTRESIASSILSVSIRDAVSAISHRFPGLGIEVYTVNGDVYPLVENDYIYRHLQLENIEFSCDSSCIKEDWLKVVLYFKPDLIAELEQCLKQIEPGVTIVRSALHSLDLMPIQVSKGSAIDILVHHLGVQFSNVLAVGDNLNDLEMLQRVRNSFAVDNGHLEAKNAARYVCPHHDNHAIAEIIYWCRDTYLNKGATRKNENILEIKGGQYVV